MRFPKPLDESSYKKDDVDAWLETLRKHLETHAKDTEEIYGQYPGDASIYYTLCQWLIKELLERWLR